MLEKLPCSALALGLVAVAAPASAQSAYAYPYYDQGRPYYDQQAYPTYDQYGRYVPPPVYTPAPPSTVDELTIIIPSRRGPRSALGAPVETVTSSRIVSYADLDLRTPWGAEALRDRVDLAARDACRTVEQMRPFGTPSLQSCIREATRDAMPQVNSAIGYARRW